jgi:prevent-host-death family protein
MERIGVRELRNNTASVVRRAHQGERIVVTVDGRPLAQLGPLVAEPHELTIDDLVNRGQLVAPRRADTSEPTLVVQPWAGIRLDRTLREIR